MKVLLVINNLGSGGAQNQITLLAQGLAERGHLITVFTYHDADFFAHRLKSMNIQHIYHKKKEKAGVSVVRKLVKTVKEQKIQVILSYLRTPNFYGAIASRLTGVAFISSYRSMTEFENLHYPIRKSMEWVNRQAVNIVANSEHERLRWVNRYSNTKGKWKTISNVVHLPSEEGSTPLHEPLKILVVGTVSAYKNGLAIIEAIGKLPMHKRVKVKWIGRKVYDFGDEYYQKMAQAIESVKLAENWTWQDPTDEIGEAYKECDFLLHASTKEGFPNVVCEALAFGKPCIVSNVLDHPLIIKEGINGYLFDPLNTDELADKIGQAADVSQETYLQMSRSARETAKAKFSKEKFLNAYENLLQSVSPMVN